MHIFQEFIFEEIRPTRTLLAEWRTGVAAYHVLPHTARVTNTVQAQIQTSQDTEEIGMRLQDILPHLLPTAPLPPSTSYTTVTITSDVTSGITITLGGCPVKTKYVIPMVCGWENVKQF